MALALQHLARRWLFASPMTNQLVKPRMCRSALWCLTAFSNPPRENSFNTCEKMLHTFIRLSLLWLNWFLVELNPAYQGAQLLTGHCEHTFYFG